MNPLASELNATIQSANDTVYHLLSQRGRQIFFPKGGILGQSAEAKDKKINATIGIATEDDGAPIGLKSIVDRVNLSLSEVFPYASSYGKPELRKTWQQLIRDKNPTLADKPITLPVVTSGLTHGLSICGYLFADEGDTIILPDYFWGNYRLVFTNAYGAEFDTFPTFREDGGFNVEGIAEKLAQEGDKKIILFNSPNNPTGYTPTTEEAHKIVEAIAHAAKEGKKILVIIDDAYFGLVFREGVYEESLFSLLADIHENVLVAKVDGATKEEYAWGFRVAFITYSYKGITAEVCTALEDKTAGAVRGNISNSPHLSQSLVLSALQSDTYQDEKRQKYQLLRSRYEKAMEVLDSHSEYGEHFSPVPCNSGYFMCIKIRKFPAEQVRRRLIEAYDTGTIAMGELLRLAFSSLPAAQIPDLFTNIYKACRDLDQ